MNVGDEARRDGDDGDDQTLAAADVPRRADDRSEVEDRQGQPCADQRVEDTNPGDQSDRTNGSNDTGHQPR